MSDKLNSDFIKQEKMSIQAPIHILLEDMFTDPPLINLNTKIPRQKLIMDFQKSKTKAFVSIVKDMPFLNKKFWEREVISNLNTLITIPYLLKENNTFFYATASRKKSNSPMKVSLTNVFGVYNHQKKQFLWTPNEYGALSVMSTYHNNFFRDLDIINHILIENITLQQSNNIAFFYRLLYYVCRGEYYRDNISSKWAMNNENLVIQEIEYPTKGNFYTVFFLTDLGVKEPPFNKTMIEDLDFGLRQPYTYCQLHRQTPKKNSSHKSTLKGLSLLKDSKKEKSVVPTKKSCHKSSLKVLSSSKIKKKTIKKNIFQKIKNFIFNNIIVTTNTQIFKYSIDGDTYEEITETKNDITRKYKKKNGVIIGDIITTDSDGKRIPNKIYLQPL